MGTSDSSSTAASSVDKPTVMAQLNSEQILKQIVQKFDVLMADGRSEAKIQLKPKYLGELKIHLIMEGGSMKAFLDAPSHQIKQILEANLASLKQSLESQGLQVQDFDVSVGQDRGSNDNQSSGKFFRNNGGFADEPVIAASETQTARAAYNLGGARAVNYLV
jgi:flagellar hook-length control protein FliK